MPVLNPYQEMIAPYNERRVELPTWEIAVAYRLIGTEEDDVREERMTVEAVCLDDALQEAEERVAEKEDNLEEIIDVFRIER